MNMAWPICMVVLFQVAYNLSTKLMPDACNPFAALIFTYLIATAVALVLYLLTKNDQTIGNGFEGMNFAPFLLGLMVIGIDFGMVMIFRVGWEVSVGTQLTNIFGALGVFLLGILFFKESITVTKLLGVACFIAGSIFMNMNK